ncbi:MAG: hypothetical protein Q8R82_06665 [Hyphomonadaceae bacterium]|nr:hypothetical protein [Hyphomonadaceae bacterium]
MTFNRPRPEAGMSADVRLTQLDGKLPNLALMRLSAFHKAQGHRVHFYRTPYRQLGEPDYAAVYGSAVFAFSAERVERFRREFPEAIIGGTGSGDPITVEAIVGDFAGLDYEPWADFTASLGFTQRGCRFACGFCVVPGKEGKPKSAATIADIWRGEPYPRHLHLLDNDFFGQPKAEWKARLAEVRDGAFKVCFNQGINVRVITDEIAAELASVDYRDDSFKTRRIYTAWDSLGDEALFMRGVDRLERAGVNPSNLMVYMLVGYDPAETWATIFRRFDGMVARRIRPYPMVYGDRTRTVPIGGHNGAIGAKRLMDFQRWANTGLYRRGVAFSDYNNSTRHDPLFKQQDDLFGEAA